MTEPIELPSGAVVTLAPPRVPPVEAAPPDPSSLPFLPSPGPRGPTGPAGNNAPVYNETPGGVINGSNTVFTTAYNYQPDSIRVYFNGLREFNGEGYTESGPNTITFSEPLLSGDILRVDYLIA